MIRRLSANKAEFLPITFGPGFNAIVADRAPDATDQQSRNARGKTSVLRVIDYLLGGSLAQNLKTLADSEWEFSLELDLLGEAVTVTRSLAGGTRLGITYPNSIASTVDLYVEAGSIDVEDWKRLLGLAAFNLEPSPETEKSPISVRTLLKYVVRTAPTSDPLKAFPQQPALASRIHIAFLLDLDWQLTARLHELNAQLDDLKSVSRVIDGQIVNGLAPVEEVELERSAAQNAVDALADRIGKFRVLEDPEQLVARADALTATIADARDRLYIDRRMRQMYVTGLEAAQVHDNKIEEISSLYEAVGVAFEDRTLRTLEQVAAFRRNLVANRVEMLNDEIGRLDARIGALEAEMRVLDNRRETLMRALRSGGAIDELLALQNEMAGLRARVHLAELRIQQSREIARTEEESKAEQASLRKTASQQLDTGREKVDRVNDNFREKMKRLYDADAALLVKVDDDGYHFATKVKGSASNAVSNMQALCFDLALLEAGVETGHHPDFLIHDSSVFDGVDPRQQAAALAFAHEAVAAAGTQYVCTINSNDVPDEVRGEAWFQEGVVRTVLDTDEGGLFGVNF